MAKNARRRHDRARWIARRLSYYRNHVYYAESKDRAPWPDHPGRLADRLCDCATHRDEHDRPPRRRWFTDIDG